MTYKLYAVTIHPKTRKVERQAKPVLEVSYEHAQALDTVDHLMATRDQSAKFGSIANPLRYEAVSPSGIAERFHSPECICEWELVAHSGKHHSDCPKADIAPKRPKLGLAEKGYRKAYDRYRSGY